jgi:hypothetical protein
MVNNVMTGKGNYLDIHTGVYEGTFQNGKLTGSDCTVKRKSNEYGNYSINGTFLNDLPHGHLTFSHPIKKQLKRDQYGDIIRSPTDPQHQYGHGGRSSRSRKGRVRREVCGWSTTWVDESIWWYKHQRESFHI